MKFKLKNLKLAGGDETHRFEAILCVVNNDDTRSIEVAHVSNGGRGGGNIYRPLGKLTYEDIRGKIAAAAKRIIVRNLEENPPEPEAWETPGSRLALAKSLKGSDALDWHITDLINQHYAQRFQRRRRTRAPRTVDTTLGKGDVVIFGRDNGEKTRGKIVKVNKKSFKVEILEDRGSRSKKGQVWRVAKTLCERAPA